MRHIAIVIPAALLAGVCGAALAAAGNPYARDPNQPVDQAYTGKIAKYTTQADFNTPLTDYLPASPTVPTPESVLGDVAGAPIWRGETIGSYRMFFNAVIHYDRL